MINYISAIEVWRSTWKTKSKYLAIVGCESEKEIISKAIDKAHQPSVGRS